MEYRPHYNPGGTDGYLARTAESPRRLGALFARYAIALRRSDAPAHLPMTVFRYSVNYLMLLFAALLVDHYFPLQP